MTSRERARPGDQIMDDCYRSAHSQGIAVAMRALHAAVSRGVLPCGPSGYAVLPAEVPERCGRISIGTRIYAAGTCCIEPVAAMAVNGRELTALRCRPTDGSPAGGHESAPDGRWPTGLAWLRLGLSERLFCDALDHLRGRTSAGVPLLDRQMVRATIADGLAVLLEARAALTRPHEGGGTAGVLLASVHRGITAADHLLLGLLGAAGFLQAGPGQVAYLSELLENAYTGWQEAGPDD